MQNRVAKLGYGNVTSIPYPSGIRPSCYMDDWFEIVCNGTGAFLKRINMEVLQLTISSDESVTDRVLVKSPIIYWNCYNNRSGGTFNLAGSPLVFSSYANKFTAVGCDNFATMTAIEPMVIGCKSESNGSNRSEELKCSGINCCKSTIPSSLQVFSAEFRSKDFQSPKNECKFAFLVYQQWFRSNRRDPTSVVNWGYAPVMLDWAIYND
nr:wall-associated receptor kinase-like 22 [Quercus suber]